MSACTVLVVGFVAAINLAVPSLAASGLRPTSAEVLWIVDAYVVLFACLVIPAGAAGDRFGRKGVLLWGLGLFALGAFASATAPDVGVLIAARALTGVGAAAVLPNSLALLVHATAAEQRGKAIAVWAAMSGIGGVIGNVGAGALLGSASWRWLFVAVIPIAVGCAVWVAMCAPRTSRHDRPLGPVAAALLTLATLAVLVGVIEGPERGWTDAVVIGGFAASVPLGAAWAIVELRSRHPLLDPRLFRNPVLRAACLGMLTMFFGSFGLFFINASLLQYGHGFTALQTGVAIIPLTLPLLIGGRYVPAVVARFGATSTVAVAFAVAAVGLYGLGSSSGSSYAVYAMWMVVFAIGFTLALPSLTIEITAALPRAQAGVGAGLQSTTRELGSAFGVAVVGTFLTSHFVDLLPAHLRATSPVPHTVAAALAADPRAKTEITEAFARAAGSAFHIAAVVMLVAGVLGTAQSVWAGRRLPATGVEGEY